MTTQEEKEFNEKFYADDGMVICCHAHHAPATFPEIRNFITTLLKSHDAEILRKIEQMRKPPALKDVLALFTPKGN